MAEFDPKHLCIAQDGLMSGERKLFRVEIHIGDIVYFNDKWLPIDDAEELAITTGRALDIQIIKRPKPATQGQS